MSDEQSEYGELANFPAGAYALALSGGADSTALVLLLRERRPDVDLHIVHLNHQTRGEESDADEKFVRGLAQRLGLPCTIGRRSEIEPGLDKTPKNKSALFRALRLLFFAETVRKHRLAGVLLGHHADDQAETILHRLLRGSRVQGLRGMGETSSQRIASERLILHRPLLGLRRSELRAFLLERGEKWREDSSNQSDCYLRNRLRRVLTERPELTDALLELGRVCQNLTTWISDNAVELKDSFAVEQLWDAPSMLSEAAARSYLRRCGCPIEELMPAVLRRFVAMAHDAATPGRQVFPGGITIRRRSGIIQASPSRK